MGILSLLLWTPALGALLLALIPREKNYLIRPLAMLFSGCTLLLNVN
jgi:NADH-quinone oxidoreductase subunit M